MGEGGLDGGEGREAGDPEDGCGEELGEAGEKPDFAEVVVPQLVGGGEPDPGVVQLGFGEFLGRGWFLSRASCDLAVPDEVLLVRVVVRAILGARS